MLAAAPPPGPSVVQPQQQLRLTTFDDLEDAVIERIFAAACLVSASTRAVAGGEPRAPARYRHAPAVPQVCRRWADVYAQSSILWEELSVDWAALARQAAAHRVHPPTAFAAAARWLAARLPYTRRLVLCGCHALAPPGEGALALAGLFPDGLSSARLLEVQVLDAWGGCLGAAVPRLLRGCPAALSVVLAHRDRLEGPQEALQVAADQLAGLRSLPALASLVLRVDKLTGGMSELAPALPGLTHLAIRCRVESAVVAPELLEGLSQLRRLELENVRLAQFTPRLSQALSQLTHLACADVLAAQPRRRAGVQLWQGLRHLASLKELCIERQFGAGMPANALACRRLQGLTLISSAALEWPAAPYRYTGEGGCLGVLASLHLDTLHLQEGSLPPALWSHLAPGITSLTWRNVRKCLPDVAGPLAAHIHAASTMQAMEVPAELSALQGLKELRLEYAQLDSVPPAVQALTQLSRLSLEGNHLASLPVGLYLTSLARLSLANSAFEQLPDALAACSSLEELSLAENCLAVSPAAAEQLARSCTRLRSLRASLPPPAAAAGAGDAGDAGAAAAELGVEQQPMAAQQVGAGAGEGPQDGAAAAAQAAQAAREQAARAEAHVLALRHLARVFGDRLVLVER